MPREAEPSLSERTFVTQALAEGLRLDNRKFEQYRPLKLTFGDEHGIAEVQLGKTRVLAKVSAEVAVPFPDRPFDGVFAIAAELSPMAAPSFEAAAGRPSEAEVLLARLLEQTIRRSGALDTESLCLVAGRACWSVRADLHVLAHDGNLLDAACLAAVAALRHSRRPETGLDPATGALTVYAPAEREPVPLGWLHSPFCVTCSFFGEEGEGGQAAVLLDATALEERLRGSSCAFGMNRHGEICQISKLGGEAVDARLLVRCAQMALDKTREFSDLVDRELAEDAKRRDKGGLMAELTAENDR